MPKNERLICMEYTLCDLIDVQKVQHLLEGLADTFNLPACVIDADGNILSSAGWQDICTKFHRRDARASEKCRESDAYIHDHIGEADPSITYKCAHGLLDCATPLMIDGKHMGTVFIGQFLLESPDREFFRRHAKECGFDEKSYLEALDRVPVFDKVELQKRLAFIRTITEFLGEMGLKRLKGLIAEEKLRESQERYKSLVENIGFGITLIDADFRIVMVNGGEAKMFGKDPEYYIGKYCFREFEKRDSICPHCPGKVAMAQGRAASVMTSGIDGKGQSFSVELHAFPTYDGHGNVAGFIEVVEDRSYRNAMESALLKSQEQLRLAIEGSGVGLWDWRVDTGELSVNDMWAEMLGFSLKELDPVSIETWRKLVHPDDLKRSDDVLAVYLRGEQDWYECEIRMRHKDGRWVWVLNRGKVTKRDSDGKPIRVTGTHLDITERKRVEAELKEKVRELESFNKLAVDRELKMVELKKELETLRRNAVRQDDAPGPKTV